MKLSIEEREDRTFLLDAGDILYIDTADKKTFLYTAREVYETPLRLALFSLLLVGVLSLCAVTFHWLSLKNSGAWLSFVGAFLACLLVFTLGFEIYFWAAGKRYDGLLGQYREKRKKRQ